MYSRTMKLFSIYDFQTRKVDYRFSCKDCMYCAHCAKDSEDRERCPIERTLKTNKKIALAGTISFSNHKRLFILMTPESRSIIEKMIKRYSRTI